MTMETSQAESSGLRIPGPLAYHRALVDYLKAEEPDLWKWFCSTARREGQAEAVRLDLLKSTYRIEPGTQPQLYAAADEVLGKFELKVPVTFYQAQTGTGMNAALAYLPGEAHIILSGPIQTALSEVELRAVLGHELAHFLLFDRWDGEFLAAAELLEGLCNDAAAAPAHVETARLFRLYSEVFADRGALAATGDLTAAITTLIKMETGLSEVSAESYLRQAEEIFSKGPAQANQFTHPEPYIRARALKLWADEGIKATAAIESMIEGIYRLDQLDLLKQQKVAETTRRLLGLLLAPSWFHSEPVLAHARLFFDDFVPGQWEAPSSSSPNVEGKACEADEAGLVEEIKNSDPALQDYYCYVLLDFVTVDREMGETALAAALVLARKLELGDRLVEVAQKELGLGKKQFSKIQREAESLLARANEVSAKT
jgi:Zn-dependent protease with chaperone function